MKRVFVYGKSPIEKMLNLMFYVTIIIALASAGYVVAFDVPAKFYSVVVFNFALAGLILHVRNIYLERTEKYESMRKEFLEGGAKKEIIDEYINNLREWDAFISWLKIIIILVLIFGFAFWLIP